MQESNARPSRHASLVAGAVVVVVVIIVVTAVPGVARAAGVQYTPIQLAGPWTPPEGSDGWRINNAGVVAGYSYHNTFGQAMRWSPVAGPPPSVQVTPLGHLGIRPGMGIPTSFADGLNNHGASVGWSTKVEGGVEKGSRAVLWAPASTDAIELPVLSLNEDGHSVNGAEAINDAGVIVGQARKHLSSFEIPFRPVRWDAVTHEITELQMLPGHEGNVPGHARAINAGGTIIGDCAGTPVRWAAGSTTPVQLKPIVIPTNGYLSQVWSINDAGTIVGNFSNFDLNGLYRAQRWDANSTTGAYLPGTADATAYFATAYDINNAGQIVGMGWRGNQELAMFWDPDEPFAIDLNTLIPANSGWRLLAANSINEDGWISGYGQYDPDGTGPEFWEGGVLLRPIPEPAALALALVAAPVLLARRRRRPW